MSSAISKNTAIIDDELDIRRLVTTLRSSWRTIAIAVLACIAIAMLVAAFQPRRYRSTVLVLLQDRVSDTVVDPERPVPVDQADTLVNTEVEVMESESVTTAVEEELGFEPDVDIARRGDTYVVGISATADESAEAARIANAYADSYRVAEQDRNVSDLLAARDQVQAQLRRLADQEEELDTEEQDLVERRDEATSDERAALDIDLGVLRNDQATRRGSIENRRATYLDQLDQLQLSSRLAQGGGAVIISRAEPPSGPFLPNPPRYAIVAVILGLLIGIIVALAREYFNDSIATREDAEEVLGPLGALATVPKVTGWKEHSDAVLISVRDPRAPASEAYRTLRTSLQFAGVSHDLGIVQVTSSKSGEGKTTTLANLGLQLAQTGMRVVLVDCDLRRPRIHSFFELPNTVGFTSVLIGEVSLSAAMQPYSGHPNLVVLASGPTPQNPSELLSTEAAATTLKLLAEGCDIVLVDSPPVLPVSDALVLSRLVDSSLIVVSANHTTRRELRRTLAVLRQIDAPMIGAVLNGVEGDSSYESAYEYRAEVVPSKS